jgi:hypothetical protein
LCPERFVSGVVMFSSQQLEEGSMLKLNASYSKKVPAEEEYSSKSFHASVEVELPTGLNAAELQQKIHDTFELVRSSVEAEIRGSGAPAATSSASSQASAPSSAPATGREPVKATNKQIQYILSLAKQKGQALPLLNQLAGQQFGVASIYELTKRDASQFVDRLKEAA